MKHFKYLFILQLTILSLGFSLSCVFWWPVYSNPYGFLLVLVLAVVDLLHCGLACAVLFGRNPTWIRQQK